MKFIIYSRATEDKIIEYCVGTYKCFDSTHGSFNVIAGFYILRDAARMMRYLNGFSDIAPMDWGEDV